MKQGTRDSGNKGTRRQELGTDGKGSERNVAGILFIISAPSGSGKSTLVSELRKQVSGVDFAVSWTTRAPRGSEEDGREYHFTTREEFERMTDAGLFLEYAEVFGQTFTARRASRSMMRWQAVMT